MEIIFKSILYSIAAFVFMLILVPVFRVVAQRFHLTDMPGSRKLHAIPVPLIGGISIFFSVLLMCCMSSEILTTIGEQQMLFMSSILMLFMGVIDDKFDIPAKNKLLIEFFIGFSMASAGFRITSFHGFMGVHELPLLIQYVLTIVITTGVVNAYNLMDGVDGLAGELSIIGFIILIILSIINGNYNQVILYSAFIGAIAGFLRFNLSKNKIFMGDAGSLYLGHILINSSIYTLNHHQTSQSTQPIFLLIIIGFFLIPVLDSLRVYLGRMKKGNSPFKADRTHLHHLLLLLGLSHRRISLIISILSAFILVFGIVIYQYLSLTSVIISLMAIFCIICFVLNQNKKLVGWLEKIKVMENNSQ